MLNSKNERGAPNAKGAIIEKVLSVRRKLYLSTASIHLLSVYHPENNAPTSLSLQSRVASSARTGEPGSSIAKDLIDSEDP